jgi:hypothetical protein
LVDADADITDASQLKEIKLKTYFLKRLYFYDQRLFLYTKNHPSLKKYSSMCAANAMKQPAVMSEDEYTRMKEIYDKEEKEGTIIWVEYPLKKGQKLPSTKGVKGEVITSLRYGSNIGPGQANIYICAELWCRQDEIVVLYDNENGNPEILDFLLPFNKLPHVQTWRCFDWNNNFADWKNILNGYCEGDYIYQIDADEMISEYMVKNLSDILLSIQKTKVAASHSKLG